jgi:hypothetical integral membrane protein (TIGR02206 family)
MNSFLINNNHFEANSWEHIISVLIFTIIGVVFIKYGNNLKGEVARRRLLLYFTFAIFLSQIAKVVILLSLGQFDPAKDLPFHLCNVAPLILWTAYYLRSRVLWGIIFLWIMAGTLQANFTPTLHQSFPHFEWFRYWIIHVWLVIALLYGIINLGYRMKFLDIFRSLLWLNVFAAIMYPVNLLLDANYLFLTEKPDGETMIQLLSDWPYYIFQLEVVALLLFSIIYLPFYFTKRLAKETQKIEKGR